MSSPSCDQVVSLTVILILTYGAGLAAGRVAATAPKGTGCLGDHVGVYRVELQTHWSRNKFPKHYPEWRPSAQWTKLVGFSHDPEFVLFRVGEVSRPEMKTFTELGRTEPFDEYKQDGKLILDGFTGPPITKGRGSTFAQFFVDGNHSRVSMIAKIVPSPDWFIGIDSFDLCDAGEWIKGVTIKVDPLDAGTDNGLTFTSPNWPTDPPEVVYRIEANYPNHPAHSFYYGNDALLPHIATFRIYKVREYNVLNTWDISNITGLSVLRFKDLAYKHHNQDAEKGQDTLENNETHSENDVSATETTTERPTTTPEIATTTTTTTTTTTSTTTTTARPMPPSSATEEPSNLEEPTTNATKLEIPGTVVEIPDLETEGSLSVTRAPSTTPRTTLPPTEEPTTSFSTTERPSRTTAKPYRRGKVRLNGTRRRGRLSRRRGGRRRNLSRRKNTIPIQTKIGYEDKSTDENNIPVEENSVLLTNSLLFSLSTTTQPPTITTTTRPEPQPSATTTEYPEEANIVEPREPTTTPSSPDREVTTEEPVPPRRRPKTRTEEDLDSDGALSTNRVDYIGDRDLKVKANHEENRVALIKDLVRKYKEERRRRKQDRRDERRRRKKLTRRIRPPRDCRVSEWTEWSPCSVTCGIGEHQRTRHVVKRARRGGRVCPNLQETTWCGSARACPRSYFNWA